MEDGLVLMYVQDGTVYPVALTKGEHDALQGLGQYFSPITVISDMPQGKAVNMIENKEE